MATSCTCEKEKSDAWNSALEALTEVINGSENVINKLRSNELESKVACELLLSGVSLLKTCKQLLLIVQSSATGDKN
jgi:hypothetical protein